MPHGGISNREFALDAIPVRLDHLPPILGEKLIAYEKRRDKSFTEDSALPPEPTKPTTMASFGRLSFLFFESLHFSDVSWVSPHILTLSLAVNLMVSGQTPR